MSLVGLSILIAAGSAMTLALGLYWIVFQVVEGKRLPWWLFLIVAVFIASGVALVRMNG